MKVFIHPFICPLLWIMMAAAGLHVTGDWSHAQHEIFDESVIQRWKDYEAFSHGLQGTARVQRTRNGKMQESTYHFKQNRECALVIGPHNRDPLLSLCLLGNHHYMARFELSKTDPTKTVLLSYTPLPGEMGGLSPFEFVYMETSRHFSYGEQTLRQVVSDPSFKVTKVVKEEQNGQELVRVDHVYEHIRHVANEDVHERRHGSLWLDPSRCWCIRRSKLSIETTTRGERSSDIDADVACEIIDHPSGFPILKSVIEQFKMFMYKNKQKNEGSSKFDYDLETNDSIPDSEFTLSAFGLPEPAGMEPVKKPIPLYVWILLAAGVCGALAFTFHYLARRRRLAAID